MPKNRVWPGNWLSACRNLTGGETAVSVREAASSPGLTVTSCSRPNLKTTDPKYKRWNAEDLPIIPTEWKLLISPASKEQFHIIEGLISSPDVDAIVNAGDPDREGQLLIDEILTTSETKSLSSASSSTPSMKKVSMNP